jgi:RNA-binding protein
MLTSKQRQFLKGLAHEKKPVVQIGHKGLTETLVKETGSALLTHELIKIKLPEGEGQDMADELATELDAEIVVLMGRVLVLYKAHPEEPVIHLPAEKGSGGIQKGD